MNTKKKMIIYFDNMLCFEHNLFKTLNEPMVAWTCIMDLFVIIRSALTYKKMLEQIEEFLDYTHWPNDYKLKIYLNIYLLQRISRTMH